MISMLYKSLLREVTELIQVINDATGEDILYHAWESRADENDLPKIDLLGIDGFSFDEDGGLWSMSCGLTLSSYEDTNLHQEVEMLDIIYNRFKEGSKLPLRRRDNGEIFDELLCTTFRLLPMGQSEFRNYRTIALEFLRTSTATDA